MTCDRPLPALLAGLMLLGCGDPRPDSTSDPAVEAGTSPAVATTNAAASPADPPRPEQANGPPPAFEIVGAEAGLDFERFDDIGPLRRILEVNGGGVAMFDFDADGSLDLFFTNGCRLPVRDDDRDTPSELFRNGGSMQFDTATAAARINQYGFATGCTIGDYDGDGFEDLYVTAYGQNSLWRNNGDGTFTLLADQTGTRDAGWGTSAAFADLNGDGHLDLYVVNYLQESDHSPTLCPHPDSPGGYVSCPPSKYPGADDVLLISDGAGGFEDVTASAGIAGLRGKGLGVVVCDLDGEPGVELYVANDGEPNFLLVRTAGNGDDGGSLAFEERALYSGAALSEAGFAQASMGIAAGDYDADGTTDLFLTHFFEDTNTLYANRGGEFFEDVTRFSQLGPSSRMMLGFGTEFLDDDNDGWLDLIVANGHIEDRTWMSDVEAYRMPPQFYRNRRDGTFADVTGHSGDYFERQWLGRGLAVGDLDRDGRIDVAVSHQLAPSVALRNRTDPHNRSLTLKLVGTHSNRSAVGARVEQLGTPRPVLRERIGGGSFQSASAGEVHLGLGASSSADLRIIWPGGRVDEHSLGPGHWALIEGQRPCLLRRDAFAVNTENGQ